MCGPPVCLRRLTADERSAAETLARSRTAPARRVERARLVWRASRAETPPAIAAALGVDAETVRRRVRRFGAEGLAALEDHHRSGRPATCSAGEVAVVVAAAPTSPRRPGLPFASWTLDRLAACPREHKGIAMRRSRIDEILLKEGLRRRRQGSKRCFERVRRARRPGVRGKEGRIETPCTAPPKGSIAACLDGMGPLGARSFPGRDLVRPQPPPAGRARQEIDHGRRGKGYVLGAFCPAAGAAFTRPCPGRGTADWVAFPEQVEGWLPPEVERVYAIAGNLSSHRAADVLPLVPAHPRREMVLRPKYAAYLNLIGPWWRLPRSLALAGRRLGTWDEVAEAIAQATECRNAHRHPFTWGRRRRHRPRRPPGIALLPMAA
jgi:transposase